MLLLNGHSLTPARKVPMETLSLNLTERDASASMTPADMTGIGVNSWLRDETEPGKGIVWRVKSISTAYGTNTPKVNLEHAIGTLKDRILFGEHKAPQITGNKSAKTSTAVQAIRYILSFQGDWVLDKCDFNVSNPYKFDGDTLFDALEMVTNSLADAWWNYDFSTYPFKLNIRKKSTSVTSVMRAGRNLTAITKSVDKSGMYTRFYPIGANDLHISGNYVEKNTAAYGVIEKVDTDQTLDTEAELRAWAEERLRNHAEPVVTIDVDGLELADATGESMDRLKLGEKCRVPLSEFGTEITETITRLSYPDKIHQPEVVKITLANNRTDITRILADAMKRGGRGGRASTRKDKEDLAWFEDTNDHVAMCAKGIIGVDADGNPNWTRLSEIIVDGEGIHQTVTGLMNDVEYAQTRIDQNEREIKMTATTTNKMQGELSITSKRVGMVVGQKGDGEDYIKAAEIAVSINESTGEYEAKIDAEKVYIGNQKSTTVINGKCKLSDVTADYISSRISEIAVLNAKAILANSLGVTGNIAANGNISAGGSISAGTGMTINNVAVGSAVNALRITSSGNTYTLQKQHINDSEWTDVGSFSRATTLSGAWSGGVFTVSASPQGNSKTSTITSVLASGEVTFASGILTVPVKVMAKIDSGAAGETGYTQDFKVNASAAVNSVTVSSVTNNQSSTTLSYVKITGTASNGNSADLWLYLAQNGNYVELRKGSATGTRIARLSIA